MTHINTYIHMHTGYNCVFTKYKAKLDYSKTSLCFSPRFCLPMKYSQHCQNYHPQSILWNQNQRILSMFPPPAESGSSMALPGSGRGPVPYAGPLIDGPAERQPSPLHSSLKANLTITFLPAQLRLALISQPMCGSTVS